MAITETVKKIFGKVLNIGTPPEKEVLYKEVIKRKAPKESAEKIMIDDLKHSVKKLFTYEDDIEFARGTPNPPVKKVAKKKTPTKKTTRKKSTVTKKTTTTKKTTPASNTKKKTSSTTKKMAEKTTKTETTKKAPVKKPITKKSADKKTVTKKPTEKKTTSTAKKATASTKKPSTKKTTETKTTTTKKKPAVKTTATKPTPKKTPAKSTVNKKSVAKKSEEKKATTKKATTKVVSETKTSAKKKPTVVKGSKRDAKIALYIKDIKKHYGEVDESFVAIVVKNLGPSIYRKDAELVSCSDPKELDTVRRNFLMKKLGIDASQGVLDAAIQDVCIELKGVRTKYRATFYYALAKKFKKESVLS